MPRTIGLRAANQRVPGTARRELHRLLERERRLKGQGQARVGRPLGEPKVSFTIAISQDAYERLLRMMNAREVSRSRAIEDLIQAAVETARVAGKKY